MNFRNFIKLRFLAHLLSGCDVVQQQRRHRGQQPALYKERFKIRTCWLTCSRARRRTTTAPPSRAAACARAPSWCITTCLPPPTAPPAAAQTCVQLWQKQQQTFRIDFHARIAGAKLVYYCLFCWRLRRLSKHEWQPSPTSRLCDQGQAAGGIGSTTTARLRYH